MSAGGSVAIARGFSDAALQSQAVFRALLTAMSEPGRVLRCPAPIFGAPLPPVLAAVALTMLDYETPVYLAGALVSEEARAFVSFHTGAPLVSDPARASIVLALSESDLPPIPSLNAGTPDYPDRSATVIVGVNGFEDGLAIELRGPGIAGKCEFHACGLSIAFWEAAAANAARFPLGVDFVLCAADSLAALPRSALSTILPAR